MNYTRILRYFTGKKPIDPGEKHCFLDYVGGTLLGVSGIVLLVSRLRGYAVPSTIYGLCLLGMFVLLVLCNGYSDSEYDAEVARYADSLKSHALNKLGVDESEVSEVPPIILSGYDFENVERVKQGQDGKWRSNIYKVIALFFSPHELHSYTLTFNTLRNAQNEGTDVYFYQDIVSVSTSSLTVKTTVDGKEITVNNPETFKLTTKGLASLTVNLLDARHVEESINAMRALIREKKQG